METIESRQILNRFTRALSSYDTHADAQRQISKKLVTLLPLYAGTQFRRVLEIGCGTGGFTRQLKACCKIDDWTINDLCDACKIKTDELFPGYPPRFIAGDAEKILFPGRYNLIASASAFQWMKQPKDFLHKLAHLLSPGGILLFSTFTPENLQEIKELTGKGLSYPTTEQLGKWLTTDFELLHMEEEIIRLTFESPPDVLRHLKNTGVTATGSGPWTRGIQEAFCRRYTELFSINTNQVKLTYCPLYIVAVKK